jgi:hypothetical protein
MCLKVNSIGSGFAPGIGTGTLTLNVGDDSSLNLMAAMLEPFAGVVVCPCPSPAAPAKERTGPESVRGVGRQARGSGGVADRLGQAG